MKNRARLFLILILSVFVSGCATYFPLTNTEYFEQQSAATKKVAVLPFNVGLNYYYNMNNTMERAEEKRKAAIEFIIRALKSELPTVGYEVIDYIPLDAFEDDDYDKRKLTVVDEIMGEFIAAQYAINKNLDDEKGANFNYSVGIRVKELNEMLDTAPDLYLRVAVNGYVVNLAALEDSTANKVGAVLSLGMSKLFALSEDITSLQIDLIDAQTGTIVWMNYKTLYGNSVLLYDHMQTLTKEVLKDMQSNSKEKK